MSHGADAAFAGSIPDVYETRLVPLLFAPYAADLAERIAKRAPERILECAAGTGALTRELVARLPQATIVATDLNQAMLDAAARTIKHPNVRFEVCDACALGFDDGSFDAAVSQFGVMFYPDKAAAFAQAYRVLRAGGSLTFNVWDALAKNPLAGVISKVYKAEAGGQACFLERAPFSYFDKKRIVTDLQSAGFADVHVETVAKSTKAHSAAAALDAFVMGSPLGDDFEHLGRDRGARVREAIFEALVGAFGEGEFENVMSALVIQALK